MNVFFDTSVLVTAMVDQLPNHEAALACYRRARGGKVRPMCSAHALAECYATLTAMPLPRRIRPSEANRLIRENLVRDFQVCPLLLDDYDHAIERVVERGYPSGVIYDALHVVCAERQGCARVYTFNTKDFERLKTGSIVIVTP
jgi:predicted nucleic acid-binding protein